LRGFSAKARSCSPETTAIKEQEIMPPITIGFFPRDRFSVAAESLQRIFDHTDVPFHLVIIDCGTPERFLREIESVIEGHENVTIVHKNHFMQPNASRDLVISHAKTEYVCFCENDVLVGPGWATQLLSALEEKSADVAVPRIMQVKPGGKEEPHFDDSLGLVRTIDTSNGRQLEILPRPRKKEADLACTDRRIEQFMETHFMLFRRTVFDRINPFDPTINAGEEIDVCLALRDAGVPIVYDTSCVVRFRVVQYPLPPGEREIFLQKWDLEITQRSLERIKERWNLARLGEGRTSSIEEMYARAAGTTWQWREDLLNLLSADDPFILVDQEMWADTDIVDGLQAFHFLDRDGKYWGLPKDGNQAVEELERLRHQGAKFIVFSWWCFWFLDVYRELNQHLNERYARIFTNDRMLVFDLKSH
jgi:GT2 family glycosyltransferase